MRREHLVGMIRELEAELEKGVGDNLGDYTKVLKLVDNDWEMKRDDTRVETSSPLLSNDGRGRLQNPTPTRWGDG